MSLQLRYAARSDVGLIRRGNEDSGYASSRMLLVADGMGGHAAGELASASAIATVADLELHPPQATEVLSALADAIDDVGLAIGGVIAADPELTGMGTTVTGIYWLEDRIALVHVGDSRAYLLREGECAQLTHDHTYVQALIDGGSITQADAALHPKRSLLMRAVDGINPVEADLSMREARVGDRYLLCSDGLSGILSFEEIAERLGQGDPTGCVTALVDLALERGAPDNVTVVIADVVEFEELATGVSDDDAPVLPVVVGAAGEPRVRLRLPNMHFPDDAQLDPDRPDAPPRVAGGPPTAPQALIDSELVVPAAERAYRESIAEVAKAGQRRQRRRTALISVTAIALVLLAIASGLLLARSWLNSQWYVGVKGNPGTGTVAVYNGVPGTLIGIPLSAIATDTSLSVGELPLFDQELVSKTIPAGDAADAERIVIELQSRAASCQNLIPPPGCPGATS
ncbi:MAG: serine/threonine-protein phosphatase [Candidatus Nanopelagicales bacterium]|nr:serine/threonine-protein phosphatase [Candidatus Nanopelagicales bacterium]